MTSYSKSIVLGVVLAIGISACVLTGCSPNNGQGAPAQGSVRQVEDATKHAITVVEWEGYYAYVTPIKLEDGTRCVVMLGNSRGGITCDWK